MSGSLCHVCARLTTLRYTWHSYKTILRVNWGTEKNLKTIIKVKKKIQNHALTCHISFVSLPGEQSLHLSLYFGPLTLLTSRGQGMLQTSLIVQNVCVSLWLEWGYTLWARTPQKGCRVVSASDCRHCCLFVTGDVTWSFGEGCVVQVSPLQNSFLAFIINKYHVKKYFETM